MKDIPIEEFSKRLSEVMESIRKGEEIVISQGVNHEKVAKLVPYKDKIRKRKLGPLEGKVKVIIHNDWMMTNEELIGEKSKYS